MKARTIQLSLLAAAFAFLTADNVIARDAPVHVPVPASELTDAITALLNNADVKAHKNAIREKIIAEQSAAMPLMTQVTATVGGAVMAKVKTAQMAAMKERTNPEGLPGRIAPPPF